MTPAPMVQLHHDVTPPVVWDALRADGYVGVQGDECECLYVQAGTVIDGPGSMFLVTSDGLMGCEDFVTSDRECSPTGPVVPVVDSGVQLREA